MTTDVKRMFVDTNILVYATDDASPWQDRALKALRKARAQEIELMINQQVLREYLAVTTRFTMSQENALLFEKIIDNVRIFRTEFTLLTETPALLTRLLSLLEEIPTTGKQIHDANLAATMLIHGITDLLTANADDFQRFEGKIHIVPLAEWAK